MHLPTVPGSRSHLVDHDGRQLKADVVAVMPFVQFAHEDALWVKGAADARCRTERVALSLRVIDRLFAAAEVGHVSPSLMWMVIRWGPRSGSRRMSGPTK